jgi:hypothetical protein
MKTLKSRTKCQEIVYAKPRSKPEEQDPFADSSGAEIVIECSQR